MAGWSRLIGCKSVRQKDGGGCGAAVARTLLADMGCSPQLLTSPDVERALSAGEARPDVWSVSPVALAAGLNGLSERKGFFVAARHASRQAAERDLLWSIGVLGRPAVALVRGCRHWVVVCGVRADRRPIAGRSCRVDGFWILDPGAGPPPNAGARDQPTYLGLAAWRELFGGCLYSDDSRLFIVVRPRGDVDLDLPLDGVAGAELPSRRRQPQPEGSSLAGP